MLIEKIKLTNFGIHRDLEFNLEDSHVVGLLGSNGSGKSTILEALKYAFTGELSGKLESYMSKNSETNGEVEVRFRSTGKLGTIKRQVGKGKLKTSFKWEKDKVIIAKKVVEEKLEEILGVDKKALANAVFLPQGHLDALLFGTKTEREELFVKLVNMSYCQKISEALSLKSKAIRVNIRDYTATLDEVNENYTSALTDIKTTSQNIIEHGSYADVIKKLRDKKLLEQAVNTRIQLLTEEHAFRTLTLEEVENAEEGLESLRAEYGYAEDLKFEDVLQEKKNSYNEGINNRAEIVAKINRIQQRDKLNQRTETIVQDREKGFARLAELSNVELVPTVKQETLNDLQIMIGELKFEAEQMTKWRDVNKELNEGAYPDVACPLCGSEVVEGEAEVEELDKLVDRKQKALENTEKSLVSLTLEFSNHELTLREHNINLEEATYELRKFEEELERVGVELKEYEDLDSKVRIEVEKDILEQTNTAIDLLDKAKEKFSEDLAEWKSLSSRALQASYNIEKMKNLMLADEEKLRDCDVPENKLSLEELESRQEMHTALLGSLTQAQATFVKLESRREELQKICDRDAATLEVSSELDLLSDLFARKGLPREYVILKFQKLTIATQGYLGILNADFNITSDPETPLSFLFQRFDGTDHVELPMSKLSGGQRVRLCTAFLLACQKELVSNVGLMTFDEPSTHLDTDGVENLAILFQTLKTHFQGSEFQIWISDHQPKLEEAFNKTLILS